MKKFIVFSILASLALAKIEHINVTPDNIKNYEQIVDIRTPMEWRQTGVIKGAQLITFDPYNKDGFFQELSKKFDLKKPIAIICRSGSRSYNAASMIDSEEINIINLNGGMGSLIRQGFKTEPYN